MVNFLGKRPHKTMHYADTDESMIPVFKCDTDGVPAKTPLVMGRRNWTSVSVDETTGDLVYDIRVEKVKGRGQTVGYLVRSPAPRWAR